MYHYVVVLCGVELLTWFFFFQAEDGIRYLVRSRGRGDVYKRQIVNLDDADLKPEGWDARQRPPLAAPEDIVVYELLSLIHI